MKVVLATIAAGIVISGFGLVEPAAAQKKESYATCKARLSKEPLCNSVWSRACAARCGSKF